MEDLQPVSAHWCHECSAQTAAERVAGGAHGDLVCANCGSGFIEAMETAQALMYVRRAVRRHERSQRRHFLNRAEALRRLEANILEAELSSPDFRQEVRRLVHTVGLLRSPDLRSPTFRQEVRRPVHMVDRSPSHSTSAGLHNSTSNDAIDEAHVLVAEGRPSNVHDLPNALHAPGQGAASGDLRALGLDFEHNRIEHVNLVERSISTSEQEDAESLEDEGEEGFMLSYDDTDEDDEASISDAEVSALELSDWESVDEDDDVGNSGDYVDARGFEELLQHFMDSDTTRRGPPPAARSAIEGLPTVLVRRVDVKNGSAMCAICKDLVELSEPAKQLPCLHLYHTECILSWLSMRNSCPVCRYELPTDDPDYEEQRKYENMRQIVQRLEHSGNDGGSSRVSDEAGGQELGREGNTAGESNVAEANVLCADASKGEEATEAGHSGNGHAQERGSLLDVIAGPLFTMVGVVVISCLGNLLLGGSSRNRVSNNQGGRPRDMRSGRSRWANLFG